MVFWVNCGSCLLLPSTGTQLVNTRAHGLIDNTHRIHTYIHNVCAILCERVSVSCAANHLAPKNVCTCGSGG